MAGCGAIEAADDVHERAFAGAGCAHDGGVLAFGEVDADGAEGGDLDVGAGFAVDLGEALDGGDEGHGAISLSTLRSYAPTGLLFAVFQPRACARGYYLAPPT